MKLVINIPDNATNGDVIKGIFRNVEVKEKDYHCFELDVAIDDSWNIFSEYWWNQKYCKGG